jgi:hypothetical protein
VPAGIAALASGAFACFGIATWMLMVGVDHALHPCYACHDPLLPRDLWKWFVATAAMYYAFAVVLAYRARGILALGN